MKGRDQRAFTLLYGGSDHRRESLRLGMPRHPPIPQVRGRLRGEAEGSFSQIQGPHPTGRGVTDSHKPRLCLLVGWGSQSSAFAPPRRARTPQPGSGHANWSPYPPISSQGNPRSTELCPTPLKGVGGDSHLLTGGALATSSERDWPVGP